MNKSIVVLLLSFASILIGCNDKLSTAEGQVAEHPNREELATNLVPEVEHLCFKNQLPYSNEIGEHLVDVECLEITADGDSVKGKFEWVPAEKGGMSGEISGTRNGNVIDALFYEVNSEEPLELKITLSSDEALVTSSDENFGSYTIKKSNCK